MTVSAISLLQRLAALLLLVIVAGCATPPSDPAARAEFEATNDPLEPMNRGIFSVNQYLDRFLIKPVAIGYATVLPQFSRNMIRNFLNNLKEPVIFANDLLQGEFKIAHDTFARFLVNSTFGIGGLFDFAGSTGLPRQTGDFGQTLYAWGVPEGPYLVLPVFGPSNPRDAIGMGVDSVIDPFGYYAGDYDAAWDSGLARAAATGVDERARNIDTLDDIQRNSIDYYAQLRSLFRQHRAIDLRHGRPAPLPDFDTPEPGGTK